MQTHGCEEPRSVNSEVESFSLRPFYLPRKVAFPRRYWVRCVTDEEEGVSKDREEFSLSGE
jgi:hypothetical protein